MLKGDREGEEVRRGEREGVRERDEIRGIIIIRQALHPTANSQQLEFSN